MALKPTRVANDGVTIDAFAATTGERGVMVIYTSTGSGDTMDDANLQVSIPTGQAPSGVYAAGVLMQDVVNLDLTRTPLKSTKDEVQLYGKVAVLRRGEVTTDRIAAGVTASAGQKLYFNSTGYFTNTDPGSALSVGYFRGAVDANNFAKIELTL